VAGGGPAEIAWAGLCAEMAGGLALAICGVAAGLWLGPPLEICGAVV
jgi:hypothetical protein